MRLNQRQLENERNVQDCSRIIEQHNESDADENSDMDHENAYDEDESGFDILDLLRSSRQSSRLIPHQKCQHQQALLSSAPHQNITPPSAGGSLIAVNSAINSAAAIQALSTQDTTGLSCCEYCLSYI